MAPAPKDRRIGWTRFLVPDPAFSWYVRGVGLGAALTALVFAGLLWWYHGKLLDLLGLYDMLDQPGVQELLLQYSQLSLVITAIAVGGAALFVIVMSLFFLHRIAGPIYRMKVHMLDLMAGEPPRELCFRQDDQLKDLADIFNDFMRHFGLLKPRAASARAHEAVSQAEPPARPQ
jgi:methyl-accepting chemotaxis protein